MNILNKIMYQNPCYSEGKRQKTKGLMLHSVGCAQPSAEVFYNNWNKPSYNRACVHAFIDATTGDVWQTLPWGNYGWHGGKAESNMYYIGVEMCESSYITYTDPAHSTKFTVRNKKKAQADCRRTYKAAVELFAKLCIDFGLPTSSIISHNEGRVRGIASAHSDPEHYWEGLGMDYTMDKFRASVARKIKAIKKEAAESFEPYMVRVTANLLNIRKGPGTDYGIAGTIADKGSYTIVEESEGTGASKWGKLKSGAGWISLDFCNKVE